MTVPPKPRTNPPIADGRGWFVVVLLSILYACSFIDRQVITLMVTPIQRDLGLTDTQISILLGPAFALFFAVLGLPMGVLVDRVSRKILIAAGVTIWSLFTVGSGLASSYAHLLVARAGVGVGEATLGPGAYSLIADYFPKERLARALSVFGIGVVLGSGLAALIGGYVISLAIEDKLVFLPLVGEVRPWQVVFIVVGLPGLILALPMLFIREPVRARVPNIRIDGLWPQLKCRRRAYAGLMGGFGLFSLFGFGAGAWLPTCLVRVHAIPIQYVGLALGLGTICFGAIGTVFWGSFNDRLVRRGQIDAPIRLGSAIGAGLLLSGLVIGLAGDARWAIAGTLLLTMFGAVWSGITAASLQIITPAHLRGRVSAVYMVVLNAGALGLGPLLVALITDYGFVDPMAVGKSIGVLGLIAVPLGMGLLWWGRSAYVDAFLP